MRLPAPMRVLLRGKSSPERIPIVPKPLSAMVRDKINRMKRTRSLASGEQTNAATAAGMKAGTTGGVARGRQGTQGDMVGYAEYRRGRKESAASMAVTAAANRRARAASTASTHRGNRSRPTSRSMAAFSWETDIADGRDEDADGDGGDGVHSGKGGGISPALSAASSTASTAAQLGELGRMQFGATMKRLGGSGEGGGSGGGGGGGMLESGEVANEGAGGGRRHGKSDARRARRVPTPVNVEKRGAEASSNDAEGHSPVRRKTKRPSIISPKKWFRRRSSVENRRESSQQLDRDV